MSESNLDPVTPPAEPPPTPDPGPAPEPAPDTLFGRILDEVLRDLGVAVEEMEKELAKTASIFGGAEAVPLAVLDRIMHDYISPGIMQEMLHVMGRELLAVLVRRGGEAKHDPVELA